MFKTLRSRIVLASVLWTAGLLFLMHLASVTLHHRVPMPRGSAAGGGAAAGLALMVAGFLAARGSLAPLLGLREKVLAVRKGGANSIDGRYPAEVQPLIESINLLIADRERSIRRARSVAGDLAHSLKTPLAILAREADAARAAGHPQLAEVLSAQIGRMSNQIDYHLIRARTVAAAPAGSMGCEVAACAASLLRALAKLYASRQLEMDHAIPAGKKARVQAEDLEEILGNLLENACKWARHRVAVKAAWQGEWVEVSVEDDGPGLPEHRRESVMGRGVRLDESAPGSGLGLAIVRDLVDVYGGSVRIEDSPMGGACVQVRLPAA